MIDLDFNDNRWRYEMIATLSSKLVIAESDKDRRELMNVVRIVQRGKQRAEQEDRA